MLQWNSCRQKPDVLFSIQGLRKLVEADYVCICFVTKHHYTELPWFSFSLFYILLFSVHIVNVNAAKSSTVFITCPWTYIYIYIYIYIIVFKVQVVIWESFPTCYFHSASLSLTPFLFLPKHCVLNGRSWAFPSHVLKWFPLSGCQLVLLFTQLTFFYSIMVKRKKLWEHIFFYSCLEWRANYLWLWIQTCYLSRFDYSTFVVLFLTSYFIISNWWPIREWNKYFFFRS